MSWSPIVTPLVVAFERGGPFSSFSPATVGKRRCRGALHNCGDSAWDLADRASVVECGARAPLCLGLRPAIHKVSTEMKDLRRRFFAYSNSATRYGVLRMTLLNGCIAKRTNVVHFDLVECSLLASNSNPINIPSPFFRFRCREVLIAYMNTKPLSRRPVNAGRPLGQPIIRMPTQAGEILRC